MALPEWGIQQLSKDHDRSAFDCGVCPLNEYIKQFALQHASKDISRSFVAITDSSPTQILGFFTLSMGSLDKENLPEKYQKKLPNFPIPIARIGRLAVDLNFQGNGLGEGLLMEALQRCFELSEKIGMLAVMVDAKDDNAKRFYLKYGFTELPDQPLSLFLPTSTIKSLFAIAI